MMGCQLSKVLMGSYENQKKKEIKKVKNTYITILCSQGFFLSSVLAYCLMKDFPHSICRQAAKTPKICSNSLEKQLPPKKEPGYISG